MVQICRIFYELNTKYVYFVYLEYDVSPNFCKLNVFFSFVQMENTILSFSGKKNIKSLHNL